jgi:hypothetical protein
LAHGEGASIHACDLAPPLKHDDIAPAAGVRAMRHLSHFLVHAEFAEAVAFVEFDAGNVFGEYA